MGVVLEAVHLELDARVAVKILRGDVALHEETTVRFLREAKAASLLRSEFVARVTDFGRSDGAPFMVMELLEGVDLERQLQHGPLPIADAVDAVIQAAAGLAEAHAAGIVHRDIKPSNLFRTQRSDGSICVKIVDFGISKLVRLPGIEGPQSPLRAITGDARVMGTPLYMSPEQLRSARDVDERTDVWSLGAVLYELVTGEPPFLADDVAQLVARVIEQEPVRPEVIRRDLPSELSDVILRALVKDRERRTASMTAFASELSPFGSAEGTIAARRASLPGGRGASESLASVAVARTVVAELAAAPPASFGPSSLASTSTTDEFKPGADERTRRAFASTRPSAPQPDDERVERAPSHRGEASRVDDALDATVKPRLRGWLIGAALLAGGVGVTALIWSGGASGTVTPDSRPTPTASVAGAKTGAPEPDIAPKRDQDAGLLSTNSGTSARASAPRTGELPPVKTAAASSISASNSTSTPTVVAKPTAHVTASGRTLW